MRLFWAQGYEATGMAELLQTMGIGRQSLYDTFGDKRTLFLEVMDHYFRDRIAPNLALLRAPGSPLGNLHHMLSSLGAQMQRDGFNGCLVGNCSAETARTDPELRKRVASYFGAIEDAYCEVLTAASEAGEIAGHLDPRSLAKLLMNTTQGMALMSRVRRDRKPAQEALGTFFNLIKTGN